MNIVQQYEADHAAELEARLPARNPHGRGIMPQCHKQALQLFHGQFLGGIGTQFPLSEERAVGVNGAFVHGV